MSLGWKKKRYIKLAYIKIRITINNVFVTLTDRKGRVLISKHSGILKFKSSKKKTPYAAVQVLTSVIRQLRRSSLRIKAFIIQTFGFIKNPIINNTLWNLSGKNKLRNIIYLETHTSYCHNGLRAKKKRRL